MRTCLCVEAFAGAHPRLPPASSVALSQSLADGSGGHVNRRNLNKQNGSCNSISPPPHSPPCVFTLTWSGDSQSPSVSLVLGFGIPVHLVPPNILTCSELWERGGRRWRWPSWRLEIKTARDRRGVGVSGDRSGGAVGLGSFFCHFWFGFSWLPVEMIHYNHGSQRRNAQLRLAPSPCSFPASFTFLLCSQQISDSSNLSSALIFLYTTSDLFSFLDRPCLLVFRQWPVSWECSAFWYHWLAADKGLTLSKVKSVNRSSFHHLTSFYPIAFVFTATVWKNSVSFTLFVLMREEECHWAVKHKENVSLQLR